MAEDEHPQITAVEALAAIAGMGPMIAAFNESLREAGFDEQDAMNLTRAYVHGLAGGKLA